jgi:hypothetical protein
MAVMTKQARDVGFPGDPIPALAAGRGTGERVTTSGSAAQTTKSCPQKCTVVRIYVSVETHYQIGPTASATTSDDALPAGGWEYVACQPGDLVSFITESGAGYATANLIAT